MAGALFSRVKTWITTEDVTYSDLNAEFDNILNNLIPTMIDDYSANVSQMQTTTDPGEVGTESLATTLAGELARLRLLIKEITGKNQWYESPVTSVLGLYNSIGVTGLTANRLVSGRVRTTSQQPQFLVPNGAARTATVKGATTNFHYFVNGVEYTISTDVNLTNLTAAPSSNNTCLVNDGTLSGQDFSKFLGEDGTEITIDTVGSSITSLVGQIAAFKRNTEYFLAEVQTNKLVKARRGFFFDSSDAPTVRVALTDNDSITLLKLAWVFAKSDGTLTPTYGNPTWSVDQPTSPATNDYWYDITNSTWKKFDVSNFVSADATLVGVAICDATNCIGARSFEFFKNFDALNTCEIEFYSNSQIRSRWAQAAISTWGNVYKNDQGYDTWDMTLDLDSGVTEGASTYYYFYRTETGDRVISNIRPYDRREDLLGWYHPHQSWRCVGSAFNDGSSNLGAVESFFKRYTGLRIPPTQTVASNIEVKDDVILCDATGAAFTEHLPPAAYMRGKSLYFKKTDSSANLVTIDGFGAETIDGATTKVLYDQYESIRIMSDGTNWHMIQRYNPIMTPVSSSSSGTYSNTGGSFTDVVSATVVNPGDRKFEIAFQSDGSANNSQLRAAIADGSVSINAIFQLLRNGVAIAQYQLGGVATGFITRIPSGALNFMDLTPDVGNNIYLLQASENDNGGGGTINVEYTIMVVREYL